MTVPPAGRQLYYCTTLAVCIKIILQYLSVLMGQFDWWEDSHPGKADWSTATMGSGLHFAA